MTFYKTHTQFLKVVLLHDMQFFMKCWSVLTLRATEYSAWNKILKLILYYSYIQCSTWRIVFPRCRKQTYIQQHLETQSFICNLTLTVTQITRGYLFSGVTGGTHVTEAHSESRRIMTVTKPAAIVHLHCVTWE